jgi:hypothetical protein
MGHLLKAARASRAEQLDYDWLTGIGGPPALLIEAVRASLEEHRSHFADLVVRAGADMAFVAQARFTIRFDLTVERPWSVDPKLLESPFECLTVIVDDHGITSAGSVTGWWFPESA